MVSTILVRHGGGSYPVLVGPGTRSRLRSVLQESARRARPVIITDTMVAQAIEPLLPDVELLIFPAGEQHKSRATWMTLTDHLLDNGYGRDTVIIAIGGGVTTDLAGFVAATYLRGVPWIAVPTSTLAMLDATVGGKTGVDTSHGKNLVGAFHPPLAVLIDPELLATLPERNYREGLAEAVKHGVAFDIDYARWIGANAAAIGARDMLTVTELVSRSVEMKAAVVAEDEFESGRRAALNAGHTVGHALELVSHYNLPHGEAVSMGLVLESRLGERMGVTVAGTADRVAALLSSLHIPVDAPAGLDADEIIAAMQLDKKKRDGIVRGALLADMGRMARGGSDWTVGLDLEIMREVLQG